MRQGQITEQVIPGKESRIKKVKKQRRVRTKRGKKQKRRIELGGIRRMPLCVIVHTNLHSGIVIGW